MAKNMTYRESKITNLSIKGTLSDDGSEIAYVDENKEEQTVMVSTLMERFGGNQISFTLKKQEDEDLTLEEE